LLSTYILWEEESRQTARGRLTPRTPKVALFAKRATLGFYVCGPPFLTQIKDQGWQHILERSCEQETSDV